MPRFLITYHGGTGMPEEPAAREAAMSAFGTWASTVGDKMVDPGAPLGQSMVVTDDGDAAGTAPEPVGGYTIIEADDLQSAVNAVHGHPFLSSGGTLQVSEAVSP